MPEKRDLATAKEAVLFASLPDDLAESLFALSTVIPYTRGETLFVQGDRALSVYLVLDGWVKLFRITPTGAEAVVGVFTRGRSFGEAAAFQNEYYPVTAEAVTEARLLQVPSKALLEMMREHPELSIAMLSATFRHLHALVAQIEQLKAHTGTQRVAEFLLELCTVDSGSCTLNLPYDKTLIAGRLGMKPQSLSRSFSRLQECGVTIAQTQAVIADVGRLRQYVLQDRSSPWSQAQ
jgi:CRP/FNR family transcriptional regulator, dissimilatory nitrate respiration regulator